MTSVWNGNTFSNRWHPKRNSPRFAGSPNGCQVSQHRYSPRRTMAVVCTVTAILIHLDWLNYRDALNIFNSTDLYTQSNKNPWARNFSSPELEVTWRTVVIIIRDVLLFPYLLIRAVSPSSIHYNQSHRVYINRRHQYICLISN